MRETNNQKDRAEQSGTVAQSVCIGRFRLRAPAGLALTGRSQSIYDVDVSTLPIPREGIEALWEARLKKIKPPTLPGESNPPNFRAFDLLPGTHAAWYMSTPTSPHLRDIEALMPFSGHAVLAVSGGEAGKESLVEELLRIVFNGYTPSTAQGFCVGDGAVTSTPGLDEKTLMSFTYKSGKNFKLRFETRTVAQPDTQSYSDVEEEKETAQLAGGKLSVLREHSRSVASLEGKEIWIAVAPPAEAAFLRFTWHFAGVPQNSVKPMINIVGTAPLDQQADLEKIWDALLPSVQSVPPSPQRH